MEQAVESDMFRRSYAAVFAGDENWNDLEVPAGDRYAWDPASTYVRRPPYFDAMAAEPEEEFGRITGARAIALLGDERNLPTTSRPQAQSRSTRRPGATSSRTASSGATSTRTAHGGAITR